MDQVRQVLRYHYLTQREAANARNMSGKSNPLNSGNFDKNCIGLFLPIRDTPP